MDAHSAHLQLIDWLIDCVSDWLLDWLIDYVLGRSIDWLIDRFTDKLFAWLIDWLIDLLINWLIDWLILLRPVNFRLLMPFHISLWHFQSGITLHRLGHAARMGLLAWKTPAPVSYTKWNFLVLDLEWNSLMADVVFSQHVTWTPCCNSYTWFRWCGTVSWPLRAVGTTTWTTRWRKRGKATGHTLEVAQAEEAETLSVHSCHTLAALWTTMRSSLLAETVSRRFPSTRLRWRNRPRHRTTTRAWLNSCRFSSATWRAVNCNFSFPVDFGSISGKANLIYGLFIVHLVVCRHLFPAFNTLHTATET